MTHFGFPTPRVAETGTASPRPFGRWVRWRTLVLAMLGVTALVAVTACGGTPGTDGSGTVTATGSAEAGNDSPSASPSASPSPSGEATGSAAGLTAATNTGDGTITVRHPQGATEVPADPENVVVFDLGVMDSLNALGIQPAGVPQARYPEQLQSVADDAELQVGSVQEPDLGAVAATDPDLIIISDRTSEAYPELSEIAPTINLSVQNDRPMESFTANTTALGTIFGQQEDVESQLREIDEHIEAAQQTIQDARVGDGLLVLASEGELSADGAGSRYGLIHEVLGIPPAAHIPFPSPHDESVSFDFIAETNPSILFVVDRDAALGEGADATRAVLDNDLVNGTDAARNGNVILLDPTRWYLVGYGLNSLPRMVNDVVNGVATESTTGRSLDERSDS